jgi:hypothetical protein
MNDNKKLHDILRCTDDETIERLAEKYTLSDEKTSKRVYERCVTKMMAKKNENSGYTEVFTAEKYKRRTFFRMAGLSAACIAVIGGVILGLGNIKPPVPEKTEEAPVFSDAASTTAIISSDSAEKVTVSASKTTKPNSLTTTAKTTTADTAITEKATQTAVSRKSENNSDKISNTIKSNDNSIKQEKTDDTPKTTTQAVNEVPIITTLSEDEKERRLAELEARKEYASWDFPRERQIILGNYSADSPRLSYEKAQQIAANCETKDEFKEELAKQYPYPDFRDAASQRYWFDDECSEFLIVRNYVNTGLDCYHRDTNYPLKIYDLEHISYTKAVLIAPELRKMEQVRADEAANGYKRVWDRAVIVNEVYKPQLSIDDVRYFSQRAENFEGFWNNFSNMYFAPTTWTENDETLLTYDLLGDDNGYLEISLENGYVMYCKRNDPDFCEYIIKDKGRLSDEEITEKKDYWNVFISMTE